MLWIPSAPAAPWPRPPRTLWKMANRLPPLQPGCWRRDDGTFDRILKALQIRLDKQGKIDWDLWLVDGTNVRASRAAAGAA